MLGFHTGLTDSNYRYLGNNGFCEYDDMIGYGDMVAHFETKCSRCDKILRPQKFAFLWADEPHFSYEKTKEDCIKEAMNFTWNGI